MEFKLSLDCLKSIALDRYEQNFTFIINGQEYKTTRFVADLLSPIINHYHYSDESITKFIINTKNDSIQTTKFDHFSDFVNLIKEDIVQIDEARKSEYSQYFLQLGNFSEYFKLNPLHFEEPTLSNVIDQLSVIEDQISTVNQLKKCQISNFSNEMRIHLKKLINFSSEHFYELDKERLKKLDIFTLEEIIHNEQLQLESEDSLFDFILDLYDKDNSYSILFEYVSFKYLKADSVRKFIDHFNIDFLNEGTWRKLSQRLLEDVTIFNKKSRRYHSKEADKDVKDHQEKELEFQHSEGHEFQGILHYLTEQTGGNIHNNGTIEITSNSIFNNNIQFHPKNLVDFNQNYYTYYHSNDQNNAYIRFDFKGKRIQLDSYSILSYKNGPGNCHLRNWVAEVSNNAENWEVIDQHQGDSTLNDRSITATFNTNKLKNFYRYVQIRQTGHSWANSYYVYFNNIDFYGKLKE